jgi:hypothetical protein
MGHGDLAQIYVVVFSSMIPDKLSRKILPCLKAHIIPR